MSITLGHPAVFMPQEFLYRIKVYSCLHTFRCKSMSQIMEMKIRNPGNFQSFLECPLYLHVIEFFAVWKAGYYGKRVVCEWGIKILGICLTYARNLSDANCHLRFMRSTFENIEFCQVQGLKIIG